jgi:titin
MLKMRAYRGGMLLSLLYLAGCGDEQALGPAGVPAFRTTETPTEIEAVAVSPTQIDVSWSDRSANETGFEVHRSTTGSAGFTLLATTRANGVTYSDGGLTHGTQYCYKVRAFRTTGKKITHSVFSDVACATPPAPPPPPVPAAPSAVNAKPTNSRQVLLTWADNAGDESGFRVERSTDHGATWSQVFAGLIQNMTTFTTGVPADQTFCFRIFAFNGLGDSPPSNVDCTAAPSGAADLTAVASAGPVVNLAWRDVSGVEDGYLVERLPSTGGPWTTVATLPPNAMSHTDRGASADIRYTYRVSATRDGGFSDAIAVSVVTASTPPPAPGAFNAVPQGSTAVGMAWSFGPGNQDGFRIERSTDGGANWPTIGTVSYNAHNFTDFGLTPEEPQCYRVRAFNAAGVSDASNSVCTTPPAAPTNLTATAVGGEFAIDLAWKDNSSVEDGYDVYRWFTNCNYYYYYGYGCQSYWLGIATLPANATSFRDTTVNPHEIHTYVVIGRKDGGASSSSNEAYAAASGPPQ